MKAKHSKETQLETLAGHRPFRLAAATLVVVLTVSVAYLTFAATRASSFQVAVTGQVSYLGSARSGVVISTCRSADPTATTDSEGKFKFTAGGDGGTDNANQGYCVRVQSVPGVNVTNGFSVSAYNNNPEHSGATSYEAQLANFNCYHSSYCAYGAWYTWDRSTDSGFYFNINDAQNPSATVNGPANGATVSGTTTFSAGASDNAGVSKVNFYVDGGLLATDTSYPYAVGWNTLGYAPGQHRLWARAYDTSGNGADSAVITVTVNNSHPTPPPPAPPPSHPTTHPTTPTSKPGGGGSQASAVPDTTAPTVPTNLQAGLNNDVIVLNWTSSTDNIGVDHYELDRSLDQTTWSSISSDITDVTYNDTTGGFNTHYYYRLRAVDAAGNASDYATADVSTGSFTSNTSQASNTTVKSDDGLVIATITAGAIDSDAQCSIISDTANQEKLKPPKLIAIIGPYTLVCKQADGNNVTSFKKRVSLAVHFTAQQTKQFGGFQFYQYDDSSGTWKLFKIVYNKKAKDYEFAVDKPIQFAVMGSVKKGISAQFVVIVILIILGIAGAVFFLLRRAKRQQYDAYIRKKYYNL